LYIGSFSPSGNRFGMSPSFSYAANVLRIDFVSSHRPVERQMPGRAIIVSLPQSSKKGKPARMVFPPVDSRRERNWSALLVRKEAVSERKPAFWARSVRRCFSSSMIFCTEDTVYGFFLLFFTDSWFA